MTMRRIGLASPFFEDLFVGQVCDDVPAVTLTDGLAAFHAALTGDRLRLPLDGRLSRAVTGREAQLAHPNLACNIAIGQSTPPSGRVMGNLFYRGLLLQRPVFVGDTLRTTTRIVALRQNRPKPGRPASGMAVFEIHVENQEGDTVLHFWRCPMLPCRDPEADTGHADSFDAIPADLDLERVQACVPPDWKLEAFRRAVPGPHFEEVERGVCYVVEARDTVSAAPELARLTLNVAGAHTDAGASHYGRRLVYGGHTISLACAQITRALPNLVTLLGWRSCDHTAPVFEGDVLRTEVSVEDAHPRSGGGGFVDLHACVFAERGEQAPERGDDVQVLDWRVIALLA
jgi:2-methylfumaryl-CoA hydratase